MAVVSDAAAERNGVGTYYHDLVQHLRGRVDRAELFCPRGAATGLQRYLTPPLPGDGSQRLWWPPAVTLWRRLAAIRPHALIVPTPGPYGLLGLLAARRLRIPLIVGFHTHLEALTDIYWSDLFGRIARRYLMWSHRLFFRNSRVVLAVSPEMADQARRSGRPTPALHGVPVGIKDIFDTEDMPTEDGTPLHAGRTPAYDATAVALLRQAGAIIMGKTVTTELAVYAPGKTRNPHDPGRTPGGSSSGSAAAVAAQMLPLALGSQTNGSIIRPASYCGVYGYKPSHGLISRYRVLKLSHLLDHIGIFARSVEDLTLAAEALMQFDDRDPAMRPRSCAGLRQTAVSAPPVPPRLAVVRTPMWDRADTDVQGGFAELQEALGERAGQVELPASTASVWDWHRTIMEVDLAGNLSREYQRAKDRLSPVLREMIGRGRSYSAVEYNHAVSQIPLVYAQFEEVFEEYDVILTPAATGEAPTGLETTGDPVFCTPWTYCGMPAISLPLLQGSNGMPIGVQLVAPKGDDGRLLRTARWLAAAVDG
mgnify:CR=1 FL=1